MNSSSQQQPAPPVVISPLDATGCRHRGVLRRVFGDDFLNPRRMMVDADWQMIAEGMSHRISVWRRRQRVVSQLPVKPRIGEKLKPTRSIITRGPNEVEDTLEAIARGDRLILGASLADSGLATKVDLLVRMDRSSNPADACYAPVTITGHNPVRDVPSETRADCSVVSVDALSLGTPQPGLWRHRTVASDGQRLGIAHAILLQWDCAATEVGVIGRNGRSGSLYSRCFFFDATGLYAGLFTALSQPVPARPERVRECQSCEFHNHCRAQLLASKDISLLLPGDRNKQWRENGINTLPELANAGAGETSDLAKAWMRGDIALRRPRRNWFHGALADGQNFDDSATNSPLEIDVDMEAHPNRGTFLWGTFDGDRYRSFTDFSRTGDEGRHVALLWDWLLAQKTAAEEQGRGFIVWVYAAQGENHWLRHYAKTYGGRQYDVDGRIVTMPTLEWVNKFISSKHFADVFVFVRKALAGTDSLGLKTVAPLADFEFSQEGVDGRAAIDLFETSITGSPASAEQARHTLEKYNADDCVATRRVRAWLRAGAPGIAATGQSVVNE